MWCANGEGRLKRTSAGYLGRRRRGMFSVVVSCPGLCGVVSSVCVCVCEV